MWPVPDVADRVPYERQPVARIALRPDENGDLDDVYALNVSMFRLVRMDESLWWMACYFEGGEELVFWIDRGRPRKERGKEVIVSVTQMPLDFTYEPGSMGIC